MNKNLHEQCRAAAAQMRKDVLRMGIKAGNAGAHYGGAFSMIEILAALYIGIIRLGRDRFILSKGHGGLAQYAALKQVGLIKDEELDTFKQNVTSLTAHPSMNPERGLDFSSGSLGQGLSFGVGSALALKKSSLESRVFVLLGDGECNEGQIWEAAIAAAHYKLNNLTAIIDANKLQYDGETEVIFSMSPLSGKWRAFGWEVIEADGHDIAQLIPALGARATKPIAVIAHTVKGKGVSFMENAPQWHHARMAQKQCDAAMAEIGGV